MADTQTIAGPRKCAALSFPTLLAVLVAAEFASAMNASTIYNALAKLYAIYGDPARVSWLITIYALSSAGSAVLISRLGDLYGRARMLKLMLVALIVGSLISASATNLDVIIFGRAIQGLSMAILPLGFGLLREYASDARELNFGVGILGGIYAFSTGIAFLISGVVIDHLGWQHIFTVAAIAALLSLILVLRFLPDGDRKPGAGRLDFVGALFILPVCALLLTFNVAKTHGWLSMPTIALLVFGVVTLFAWAIYELAHDEPLVDLRLLRNPTIAIVNAAIFFMAVGPLAYPQVIMPLLQQPTWTGIGMGISATFAAVLKLPTNLSSGIAGIGTGLFARRFSLRPAIVCAALANFIAFAALALVHNSLAFVVVVCVLLVSPAVTILFACAPGLIIQASPPERTSEVTGLSSVLRSLAQAIGAQLAAITLASSAVSNAQGTHFPDTDAYVLTFAMIAFMSLLSFACTVMIPKGASRGAAAR